VLSDGTTGRDNRRAEPQTGTDATRGRDVARGIGRSITVTDRLPFIASAIERESIHGCSVVRYKVRPDRADENETLVRAVYEQLHRERPGALRYATFRLPDGVSFMHLVVETDEPGRILNEVSAFQAFVAAIGERCDEPPVVSDVKLVGSYGLGV
jgi:quinol monooxygenase YgiN